jgi:tetratricopeptide (TPR) repeat protein
MLHEIAISLKPSLFSRNNILLPCLLLLFQFSFAQMDKADKLFSDYKYAQAAALYKPIADDGNIRAVRKLAECYRKINDYENAEKYFAIVVEDKNAVPKSYLYYGQILMTNEKYKEAKVWLQKYISLKTDSDTALARTLLISCENSFSDAAAERKISVENYKALNTPQADFCAVPCENGILFTSTRQGKINATSGSAFQEIYYAAISNDSVVSIEPLKGGINSKNFNSGPACMDTMKDILYFTKNNYQYGDAITNKKGDVTLKLFSARKNGDSWKDIKELELNDTEYSCAFPSINQQGDMLYFTSDRAGGFGGKDIYYSVYKNGTWSKPKNAGRQINTAGDERYPFIHTDGTLYFSSTGLTGLAAWISTNVFRIN